MVVNIEENSIKELSKKSTKDIVVELQNAKEELFNLRFQKATGQLTNTARLGDIRRGIARMYTILRERDLGIIAEPVITKEASDKATSKKKVVTKKTAAKKSDSKETEE